MKKKYVKRFNFNLIYPTLHDAVCSIKSLYGSTTNIIDYKIQQQQQDDADIVEKERDEEFNCLYFTRF